MGTYFKKLRLSYIFAFVIGALFMTINVSAKTITLDDNSDKQIVVTEDTTIDLNGKKLEVAGTHAIVVMKGATLTIKGDGSVIADRAAIFNKGGVVNILGGSYLSNTWYTIKNLGVMTIKDGTIGGVKQKNDSSLVANGYYDDLSNDEEAKPTKDPGILLTIDGGKFTHLTNTSTIKSDDWSKTVINNGEFTSENGFLLQASGDIVVNGGKFTGYNSIAVLYGFNSEDLPGTLTIKGGTFNAKYIARADNDGYLTITGGDFTNVTDGVINPKTMCGNYDKKAKVGDKMCPYTSTISGGKYASNNNDLFKHLKEGYDVLTVDDKYVVDKTPTLELNKNVYYVEKGKTIKLDYTANETAKKYLTIKSENTKVATVKDGVITGVSAGKTSIVLNHAGMEDNVEVIVYEVKADESTKNETSNVTNIVKDLLDNKDVKGVDKDTKEKIVEAVKSGKTIETELSTKEIKSSDLSSETKKEINKTIKKDEKIAAIFDINVLLKASNNNIGKLTELENAVLIGLDVPNNIPELKTGYTRKYYVIRIHNGKAERLDATYENGKVTFKTDKFSDYILTYEDVESKTGSSKELDDTPKTGDVNYSITFIIFIMLTMVTVKLLKRN